MGCVRSCCDLLLKNSEQSVISGELLAPHLINVRLSSQYEEEKEANFFKQRRSETSDLAMLDIGNHSSYSEPDYEGWYKKRLKRIPIGEFDELNTNLDNFDPSYVLLDSEKHSLGEVSEESDPLLLENPLVEIDKNSRTSENI